VRVAFQVLLAYALLLVLGALWRKLPIAAAPDLAALFAVYLGLTARTQLAPSTAAAIVCGYLGDLLMGTPRGLLALSSGLLCASAFLIHRRLLVRGRLLVMVLSALTGMAAGLIQIAARAWLGLPLGTPGAELITLLWSGLMTGLAGPLVFRLCRLLDARFARTDREREAALAGVIQ
jgi:cell shape-determining protein MreD